MWKNIRMLAGSVIISWKKYLKRFNSAIASTFELLLCHIIIISSMTYLFALTSIVISGSHCASWFSVFFFLLFSRVFLSQIEWSQKKKLKENKTQQTDWLHEVYVCHSQNFNRHRYVSKNTHCGWRHEWNDQRKQISCEWRQRPIKIVCKEPTSQKCYFHFGHFGNGTFLRCSLHAFSSVSFTRSLLHSIYGSPAFLFNYK